MIAVVVFLYILFEVFENSTSVNLEKCKLTHEGTEYVGKLSKTETDMICLHWNSTVQKGSIVDNAFPDGSKILAENYCRNPNQNPKEPWCFTEQKKFIFDVCDVPLCQSLECRISGTGMEYAGSIEKSSSGRNCIKWKDKRKMSKEHKKSFFKNRFFPERFIDKANNKCRNPDGNISGPWCFVKRGDGDSLVKELCDIPVCDDKDNVMYSETSASGKYFFFSSITDDQLLNISFRLWNPADWLHGKLYLFLSAYDIASDRKDIERLSSGVEIQISHNSSGILPKKTGKLNETPMILSGAKWTNLEITWTRLDDQYLLIQICYTLKVKSKIVGKIFMPSAKFQGQTFRYFSLGGSPAFWNIFSNDKVHTVTQMNFTRFWPMKKTTLGKEIKLFIRTEKNACITMRTAPMNETYQVQIVIEEKDKKIKIFSFNGKNHSQLLTETSWTSSLSFWKWEFFKIRLFRDKLQLFWIKQNLTSLLVEAVHSNIEMVMWTTFGSTKVSYWTIDCDPQEIADFSPHATSKRVSEEDILNQTINIQEKSIRQYTSKTNRSFFPKKYFNKEFIKPCTGRVISRDFNRRINNDPKYAYSTIKDLKTEHNLSRLINTHRSKKIEKMIKDSRMTDTGNDFIGKLNPIKSKRQCKIWKEVKDEMVNKNNCLYCTLKKTRNYSRNSSKNLVESWYPTKSRRVPKDLCLIKDCEKPLECTALTSGYKEGTFIFILPTWRNRGLQFWLKAWNPDIYEGLKISMFSLDHSKQYKLLIGDEENEKVKLFYTDQNSEILLLHKTLPHLVPTGKWEGYWLRPGLGKVELGYHGLQNTFFEWTSSKEEWAFEPMFINFGTIQNKWIGINFECNECLTTQTSVQDGYKIYPINLWRNEVVTSNLYLNLRGTGSAFITLMWTKDFKRRLAVEIMSNMTSISIIKYINNQGVVLASFPVSSAMMENEWSEYKISFTETTLIIHKDDLHLLEWSSPFPLLFYWFTVTAEGGTVIWTANCPPLDIDGDPRDGSWGKWGPWSCSVTCGKGEGRTERKCNDPPPNVYGKECKGSSIYEGPCNDFPCGKISPGTNNIIRQYLSSQHKSLQVDAADKVVLTCNSRAISLIAAEVSEVNITWSHNGFPYSRTKFHMDENYSLVIHRAQEKHNGIYLCIAYQEPDSFPSKIVLEVISLVVIKPKPTKKIRKGKSLTLKCNGLALSYVYADLSQRWELNGTIWKDYGLGTLQTFTTDKLQYINDSHTGVWTCVIIQEDFKFKWTSNWIYLKVKSAPSFWSHLMEDVATAPIFGKLGNERDAMILLFALTSAVFIIIVLIIILLIKGLKK